MISYIKAKEELSKTGSVCSHEDFVFISLYVLGISIEQAYLFAYKNTEIQSFTDSSWDKEEKKVFKEAKKAIEQPCNKKLLTLIRLSIKEDENIEQITSDDLMRILTKYLKGVEASPEMYKSGEIVALLKVAIEKFVKDDTSDNIDKHITIAWPRYNGFCSKCNREIDIVAGAYYQCPHECGNWIGDKETATENLNYVDEEDKEIKNYFQIEKQ